MGEKLEIGGEICWGVLRNNTGFIFDIYLPVINTSAKPQRNLSSHIGKCVILPKLHVLETTKAGLTS